MLVMFCSISFILDSRLVILLLTVVILLSKLFILLVSSDILWLTSFLKSPIEDSIVVSM
jgi:hypothetical protein